MRNRRHAGRGQSAMDADGVLDAVTPVGDLKAIAVVLTDGAGNLGERIPFSTGSSPVDVVVTDLDDDGRPDVVASNAAGQSMTVFGSNP